MIIRNGKSKMRTGRKGIFQIFIKFETHVMIPCFKSEKIMTSPISFK